MFDLFKKLLMSRQLTFENGQIRVTGEISIMIHGPALIMLTDNIIEKMGKEGVKSIYAASKEGGMSLAKAYKSKFHLAESKLANLLMDLASMGGWGRFEFIKLDFKENIMICTVKESPFARLSKQKKKKVCHMIRGLLAGGASIGFGKDVECIETKCLADGSNFCEFIVKPKKEFKEKNLVKEQL